MIFGYVAHPTRGDLVYAIGVDGAAWERSGAGWRKVGGAWTGAGSLHLLPDGHVVLYGRGTDAALWALNDPGDGSPASVDALGGILYPPA